MSIPVQTPFNLYIANGSTTVFPYRFLLNQASDLRITADGKTVSSGFSVSGEGNQSGGQITFSTPPASGTKIAILRNIPLRRDTEYQDNGDLLASTINADFDRLWMAVQGLESENNLALSRSGQDVNYYDAKEKPVKNLGDPVDPQDAATKKSLDSAVASMGQQVQEAKTHLDVVWQSVSQNALLAQDAEQQAKTAASNAATEAAGEVEKRLQSETVASGDNAAFAKQYAESSKLSSQNAEKNALASSDSAKEAKTAALNAASDVVSTAVPEAVRQIKAAVADDANRADTAATNAENSEAGAQQALKDAQAIAKTPGKSAWEIWKDAQPAGTDTSMKAYLNFQEGKPGKDGAPGTPGKDAASPTAYLGIGSYLLAQVDAGAGGSHGGDTVSGDHVYPVCIYADAESSDDYSGGYSGAGGGGGATASWPPLVVDKDTRVSGTWRVMGKGSSGYDFVTLVQRIA